MNISQLRASQESLKVLTREEDEKKMLKREKRVLGIEMEKMKDKEREEEVDEGRAERERIDGGKIVLGWLV
jgi:hypothetical protein